MYNMWCLHVPVGQVWGCEVAEPDATIPMLYRSVEVCLHEQVVHPTILKRCVCVVVVNQRHCILRMKAREPPPAGCGGNTE